MKSLGVLASHPIQYQAPLFRELAKSVRLHVYFAHRDTPEDQAGAGFGVPFCWDSEPRFGYDNSFLHNTARRPGFERFAGCNTPEIAGLVTAGK